MKVELIYEQSCPNIEAARTQLLKAFNQANIAPRWQEWEVSQPETPEYAHGYGSPTILVNGRDVSSNTAPGDDECCQIYCRIYSGSNGRQSGVPSLTDIANALKQGADFNANRKTASKRWRLNSAMLPAIGVAFLPKLACPACWPAYAGLLSSLGLGFIDYTPYLLPFTLVFLLIALAALAYRARQRYGYRPFVMGLAAGIVLLTGKFGFNSDPAMYFGLGLLVAASVWNTWPKKPRDEKSCPACHSADPESVNN